jgi:hypothetical protein
LTRSLLNLFDHMRTAGEFPCKDKPFTPSILSSHGVFDALIERLKKRGDQGAAVSPWGSLMEEVS